MAEVHKLLDGEDLSEKVNFVLVDLPTNVQNNRTDDHAKYGSFGLNDMSVTEKVLPGVKKPKTRGHIVCSALPFTLWTEVVPSIKRKRPNIWNGIGEDGPESKASKSVELYRAFETEKSTLH